MRQFMHLWRAKVHGGYTWPGAQEIPAAHRTSNHLRQQIKDDILLLYEVCGKASKDTS